MPFDSETSTNWSSDDSRSSVLSEYSYFCDINSSVVTSTVGDNEEYEDSPSNFGTSDLNMPDVYRPKRGDYANKVESYPLAPKNKSNHIPRLTGLCMANKVGIRAEGDGK